ncbi:hypothetical protein SSP35_21_00770 [Streptomyces sp. NBRC 110611]|uniref:M60 family metallopeptidase n=1 Tax=Streptomyces sp. NBRC 110611 TaxID=1621259 RepID=UPI000856EAA0|nr:M60 family metallopeptidase [Streptomyces sp. NBRC 110611]GAU70682.1 hypothetical protein SSP35_21_00770 [Streptomyces sp. NBRC 110611]
MEYATECNPVDVKMAGGHEFRITPSSEAERKRLGLWFQRSDTQPTGAYANADEPIVIEVSGIPAGTTMEAVVGTHGYGGFLQEGTEDPRTYQLAAGVNKIQDATGGLVWIRAVSDMWSAKASARIEITGSGIRRVPVYRQGEHTPADWPWMLDHAEMKENRSPVQLVGEQTVLTVWRESALRHRDQNPDELLNAWERIQQFEDGVSGQDGRTARDMRTPLWILVSEKVDGNPNASNFRVSLPNSWGYDRLMLTVKGLNDSWGIWHELGHMHQQISWTPGVLDETSVNIYSLAVQRALGQKSRAADSNDAAQTYLAIPEAEKDIAKADLFVRLVMHEQLRLAFGEGYYPNFHKEARANGNSALYQGDAQYRKYFMLTASKAAGKDLTGFFVRWGMKPDARTREAIAALKLPAPDHDLTTLRLPAYSAGFGENILQVPGSGSTPNTGGILDLLGRPVRQARGGSRRIKPYRGVLAGCDDRQLALPAGKDPGGCLSGGSRHQRRVLHLQWRPVRQDQAHRHHGHPSPGLAQHLGQLALPQRTKHPRLGDAGARLGHRHRRPVLGLVRRRVHQDRTQGNAGHQPAVVEAQGCGLAPPAASAAR